MRKILRPKQQCEKLGVSPATLHRLGKQSDFPCVVSVGPNSSGRFDDELDLWLESRKGIEVRPCVPLKIKRGRKLRHAEGVTHEQITDEIYSD